jgi:transcriptional regulator with AAA-type ATPase domain
MERFGTDRLASAGPPPELARDGGAPGAAAGDAQQVLTVGLKEIGRRAAATAEATTLREVLERVRWHRLEAARMLGVSYKTLLYKLKQHGLAVAACCWLALR